MNNTTTSTTTAPAFPVSPLKGKVATYPYTVLSSEERYHFRELTIQNKEGNGVIQILFRFQNIWDGNRNPTKAPLQFIVREILRGEQRAKAIQLTPLASGDGSDILFSIIGLLPHLGSGWKVRKDERITPIVPSMKGSEFLKLLFQEYGDDYKDVLSPELIREYFEVRPSPL